LALRAWSAALSSGRCGHGVRAASSLVRKRRRVFHAAQADPDTHQGSLKKLREKAAVPTYNTLRYLAENKIGKPVTTAERRGLWFDLQFKKYAPVFLGQFKPRMKFWTAALEESQLPLARLPEVAIAGRSNSGKSTLVNYLCGQHSARVMRTPGSTNELVFWQIGKPAQLCIVDLPGYGFAYAPEETRLQWTEFTLWYIRSRRNLKRVILLLDSRFGLKPADREMVAYFERHNVSWQIVLTKTDKITQKDLSRKITLLKEDCKGFEKMLGDPIPVSSLKRQGMDALRETLDVCKVAKDIVRDGIRTRVYDLLEQKRIQRSEKARKKRQKAKELKAEEDQKRRDDEAAASMGVVTEASDIPTSASRDLHTELEDYYSGPTARTESVPEVETPVVAQAHYSLEDRDSQRVDSFVRELFPDLVEGSSIEKEDGDEVAAVRQTLEATPPLASSISPAGSKGFAYQEAAAELGLPDLGALAKEPSSLGAAVGDLGPSRLDPVSMSAEQRFGGEESDSDDESDMEDDLPALPPVMRFEPTPAHAGFASSLQHSASVIHAHSSAGNMASSMMDSSGGVSKPTSPFPGMQHSLSSQLDLRKNWQRYGNGKQDRLYEADDFVSPQDRAQGLRPWAPPQPVVGGQLLAEARKRYEREWAMELDDVERKKTSAPSSVVDKAHPLGNSTRPDASSPGPARVGRGAKKDASEGRAQARRPLTFIGKEGLMEMPSGHAKKRIMGRAPSKILKQVRQPDAAKAFGFSDKKRVRRKRNLGYGLDEETAKEKWMTWAEKHEKKNPERVREAQEEMEEVQQYGEKEAAFKGPQPRYHTARGARRPPPSHEREKPPPRNMYSPPREGGEFE